MPTYDYKCTDCEHVQEVMHRMSEKPKVKCEKCSSKKMVKQLSGGHQINMGEHPGSGLHELDNNL